MGVFKVKPMIEEKVKAGADVENAGAQGTVGLGGAQGAAGQVSQGAAATTGGAQKTQTEAEGIADVGQAEAYILQLKRLIAGELDYETGLRSQALISAQRSNRNAEDHDGFLRQMAQQSLQNAVKLADRVATESLDLSVRIKQGAVDHDKNMNAHTVSEKERTVRTGDHSETIRLADLASNPILADIVAGAAATAAAETIRQLKQSAATTG